jgi:urease accessory protein UreH
MGVVEVVELGRSSMGEAVSVEHLKEVTEAHCCGSAAVGLLLAGRYGLLAASSEVKVAGEQQHCHD